MIFNPKLRIGRLIKRYKRFLADVEWENGECETIYCPNTGSMKNCIVPGARIWCSKAKNEQRKYAYTWELIELSTDTLLNNKDFWQVTDLKAPLVCINTQRANQLVGEAIDAGIIKQLQGYDQKYAEVVYGNKRSRIDWCLKATNQSLPDCFVEVKNVTMALSKGLGAFPDAVSERALKHLQELIAMAAQGYRSILLYCVPHSGIQGVAPADDIDPDYGKCLRLAVSQGVEILAYGAQMSLQGMRLKYALPVYLDPV